MTAKFGRSGQSGKGLEERVGYALGHRIRIAILNLLIEGIYTADDIASIIGESRQNVHHHLRELLSGSSIEVAKVEKRRNTELHYYRAVEAPEYDKEAIAAATTEERQALAGLIAQHSSAELMAALAAGKLSNDPQVWLAWRWLNLDAEGRRDLTAEQERFWKRAQELEAEATNRRAKSGEEATSYIVAQWGFERARTAPVPPPAKAD